MDSYHLFIEELSTDFSVHYIPNSKSVIVYCLIVELDDVCFFYKLYLKYGFSFDISISPCRTKLEVHFYCD